jgi:hypothetical protein
VRTKHANPYDDPYDDDDAYEHDDPYKYYHKHANPYDDAYPLYMFPFKWDWI